MARYGPSRDCLTDLVLATRPARRIRQAVADGYGTMMALRGTRIIRVPLIEGTSELKLVTPD
jgi:6-phosphofructokinase 1